MDMTLTMYRGNYNESSGSATTKNYKPPPSLDSSQIYESSAFKTVANFN